MDAADAHRTVGASRHATRRHWRRTANGFWLTARAFAAGWYRAGAWGRPGTAARGTERGSRREAIAVVQSGRPLPRVWSGLVCE